MHPDTTLKVIGIAFTDASFGSRRHYYDGSLYEDLDYVPDYVLYNEDSIMCGNTQLGLSRNLATVHYNIYDKNMALIYTQSRCLADESVSRYIEMGLAHIGDPVSFFPTNFIPDYFGVTEIYFDTTLTLSDTFYISRTLTLNNDNGLYYYILWIEEYHPNGGTTRLMPQEKRLYRDTLLTGTWHEEEYGWHVTGLFPIISRDGDSCPQVRNVEFFKSSQTQFFLRWARGVNHHDWQVSLCPIGTAPDDGTLYTFNDPITTPFTVDPDSHYVAYVRARCRFARDEWGPWSDPVDIYLNQPTEITAADAVHVTLTPNPAATSVNLTASAPITLIEAIDESGKLATTIHADGVTALALDLRRWPQGAYIVRIHTLQGVVIKKLTVSH